MKLFIRLATYLLLISTFDNTLTNPIRDKVLQKDSIIGMRSIQFLSTANGLKKMRRQIVQPGWTPDMGIGELFQDFNVKVTDRKLEETEAIREGIHDIVQNGTYVVELDKGDFKKGEPEDTHEPGAEIVPEPKPQPEPEPAPAPVPETEPAPEPEPAPAPAPKPEPAPQPQHILEQKPKPQSNLKPKTKEEPRKPSKKPEKNAKAESVGSHLSSWFKKLCLFKRKYNH